MQLDGRSFQIKPTHVPRIPLVPKARQCPNSTGASPEVLRVLQMGSLLTVEVVCMTLYLPDICVSFGLSILRRAGVLAYFANSR